MLVLFTLHVHVLFSMVKLVERLQDGVREKRLLFLYMSVVKSVVFFVFLFFFSLFYREYLCTETILSALFSGDDKGFLGKKNKKKDVGL